MAYPDFTLAQLQERFGLVVQQQANLVRDLPPVPVSDCLRENLRRMGPVALDVNTEKARSEFLIAPVLAEVREQLQEQISVFSGVDFNVDPEQGLRGACDFLLGLSPQQLALEAPLVAVVEAKNENIPRGVFQCLAELVAIREFNAAAGRSLDPLLGVVTTGSNWRFLRLQGSVATVDRDEYYLGDVEHVVGIFVAELRSAQARLAAAGRP
ncbi:MAG: hypothetical protein FJX77_01850 [Armatimonadetes bacterium]|nr:hypothetical protein [Armatimonadota bacterium]